jgi:hypothetical protein
MHIDRTEDEGLSDAEQRLAYRDATAANAHLESVYGFRPPSVYFVQRRPDGPIKIGHAHQLSARFAAFYTACPDPVIVRAVVPGGQSLEHWFHRRHLQRQLFNEWYTAPGAIIEDAREFANRHAEAYADTGDIGAALRAALRHTDPVLADVERLYNNGVALAEIAALAGMGPGEFRAFTDKMRALGFELGYRRVFASRASRSPRFERPAPELGSRPRMLG